MKINNNLDAVNDVLTHPDFIWTWKESPKGKKQSLYIPYLQSIAKVSKSIWLISFNGGEVRADTRQIDSILFYGASGAIPLEFLDDLRAHAIHVIIHRRNVPVPCIISPGLASDPHDLLTKQIIQRANKTQCAYLARVFIREKLIACQYLSTTSATSLKTLAACRHVQSVRSIEATAAKKYWAAYFERLNISDGKRRDFDHPVNEALDAGSLFLSGILLRWCLFHKFSPYHGFLHEPTAYISLVYDLMEPYRHWVDQAVLVAYENGGAENLIPRSIELLKNKLDSSCYVPATHQNVRCKSLLHGIVLSLRAWLLDEQTRFVVPVEGKKKGGRPPSLGFVIPGYKVN